MTSSRGFRCGFTMGYPLLLHFYYLLHPHEEELRVLPFPVTT